MEIHRSARKHRVADPDITHAYKHALVQLDLDPAGHPPRFAMVGPDTSGNFIELICIEADDSRTIVIHAMRARRAFLALLHDTEDHQ